MTTQQASAPKVIQTQFNFNPNSLNLNRLRLRIQQVPRELAIAPNRFFLTVDFGDDCHIFPVQLTREEACQMIEQAQGLTLPGDVR
jgi:hypothetical protein